MSWTSIENVSLKIPTSEIKTFFSSSYILISMNREKMISMVKRYMEDLYCKWQYSIIDEIIHPECMIETVSLFGAAKWLRGKEGARARVEMSRQAFPDADWSANDYIVEDNKVAVHWRLKGTHRGAFFGIEATFNPIDVNGVSIFHFRDGLICQIRQYMDSMQVVNQLNIFQHLEDEDLSQYMATVGKILRIMSSNFPEKEE